MSTVTLFYGMERTYLAMKFISTTSEDLIIYGKVKKIMLDFNDDPQIRVTKQSELFGIFRDKSELFGITH